MEVTEMKHHDFKELLILSTYDELEPSQAEALQRHLADCDACRAELSEIEALHACLEEGKSSVPHHLLWQSRERLFDQIHRETRQAQVREPGWMARSWQALISEFRRPAFVGSSLAMLAVGLLAGFLAFSGSSQPGASLEGHDPFSDPGARVSRVSFEASDLETGTVQLAFEVSRRFELEGSVKDSRIQRLLAYALLHETNPGTRLRAIGKIGEVSPESTADRSETQAALIGALRTDDNPSVREQALQALKRFPTSPEIQKTYLQVLSTDKNARLRMAAIDALVERIGSKRVEEQDLLEVLRDSAENDRNEYVRIRAQALIEGTALQESNTEVM
ncbi:MAG: HEAT repeat domain-containing protein [Acidobacteriota bacterium]|nr:MAG: HEAT repeat domain-containing protein [Acidobacteriota bacterium]